MSELISGESARRFLPFPVSDRMVGVRAAIHALVLTAVAVAVAVGAATPAATGTSPRADGAVGRASATT
jgi:hypothetical protein